MITQEQFDRLPVVMQDIVNCDRLLGNLRRRDVVDFKEFRRLSACRAEARIGADQLWGYTARTSVGGPAHA